MAIQVNPDELLASIPALLGCVPRKSLVMLTFEGTRLGPVMRADLPPPELVKAFAETMGPRLENLAVDSAVIVIVDDTATEVSRRDVADALKTVCESVSVSVPMRVWLPSLTDGSRFRCYDDESLVGVLPDPQSTRVAAELVWKGSRTYGSREELAQELRPDPTVDHDRVLALVQPLIEQALDDEETDDRPARRARLEAVRHAIRQAAHGVLPAEHESLVLTAALADLDVRDTVLMESVSNRASQGLWRHLLRTVPGPASAEAAVLLAISAAVTGEGLLATIALDRAQDLSPGHNLSGLVSRLFDLGMSPEQLRELINELAGASVLG